MLKIENKCIKVFDGAFAHPFIEELFGWAVASTRIGWRYGDVADAKYSLNPFWGATVMREECHGTEDPHVIEETPMLIQQAWTTLRQRLQPYEFAVRDILVNGQTYGIENAIHTDCPRDTEGWYTALLYLNPKWHVDWGGETIFYNKARSEVVYAVVPKPGRILFFDARHHHWGRPPTRNTQNLRVTVAFCLTRKKGSVIP